MEEDLPMKHEQPRSSAQQASTQLKEPFPLTRCGPQSTFHLWVPQASQAAPPTQTGSRPRHPSPVLTQPAQPPGQPGGGVRDLVARMDLPALLQRLQRSKADRARAPGEPGRDFGCSFSAASMQVRSPLWRLGSLTADILMMSTHSVTPQCVCALYV